MTLIAWCVINIEQLAIIKDSDSQILIFTLAYGCGANRISEVSYAAL